LRLDSSFAYRLGIVWPREGAFTGALQRHQAALNWRIPVRFFLMKSANFPRNQVALHAALESPSAMHLSFRGKFADFIKKNRTGMRQFKAAPGAVAKRR